MGNGTLLPTGGGYVGLSEPTHTAGPSLKAPTPCTHRTPRSSLQTSLHCPLGTAVLTAVLRALVNNGDASLWCGLS